MTAAVRARLDPLLAAVLGRDPAEVATMRPSLPLFAGGLGLDSLTGMRLLAAIDREFGVDVAAEDLALDCLESIETLTAYLAGRA
ncbi:MAG TPA: acyl carrier protein [Candidatus Dormibacteraeota bacterium]|nr:acyl carrier protein [Candidatus Dormibacteraeota bacterium]